MAVTRDAPLSEPVPPLAGWLSADLAARLMISALAVAAVIGFDLNLPVVLIGAAVLAAVSPSAALLVWIAATGVLMVPLYQMRSAAVYFGTAYLCLLLAGAASDFIMQRRAWHAPMSLTAALVTLALVAAVAGLHGALDYDRSVPGVHRFVLMQIYAVALIVLSAAAALLVAYRVEDARAVLWTVIGVATFCAFAPIVMPPSAIYGWHVMLAAQATALIYALLLRAPPRSFWLRSLGAAFIAYEFLASFVVPLFGHNRSQWVSAWIALGMSIGVITWVHFPKLRWRLIIPSVVVAAGALWPYILRAVERAQKEGDFGRVQIWKDAVQLWLLRPMLGVGPGNYIDYIERYAKWHPYGSAHGNYQQVLAETGIVGIAVLLWVLVAAVRLAVRNSRSADPFTSAFGLGALGALAGQMGAAVVGDYLLPAYHNAGHTNICVTIYIWILIGALMAMEPKPGPFQGPSLVATR